MRGPATWSRVLVKSRALVRALRVSGIVAGQRLQQQRVVGDGARHWADMVQCEGQQEHAAAADEAIVGFNP